jgi:hypothetical protein
MAQNKSQDGEIARGDEATIRALCNALLRAFEEFYNASPTPVDYVDGFMAAHNFHVQIVLDLERRVGMDHNDKLFWRKVALDTFRKALEERP